MDLIVQSLIIVYSLVFPQTLFLNKTIIKRATFLWLISSVYSHVIYKIIFSYFVTIAAMIWSISSVFSLVSYQTSILDIIFVTRAVVIFFSMFTLRLLSLMKTFFYIYKQIWFSYLNEHNCAIRGSFQSYNLCYIDYIIHVRVLSSIHNFIF